MLLVCVSSKLGAQTIAFTKDSLALEAGSSFLNLVASAKPAAGEPCELSIDLQAPAGWRVMNFEKQLKLPAQESRLVSFVLCRQRNTEAAWLPVIISCRNRKNNHTIRDTVLITCEKQSEPAIEVPEPVLVLTEKDKRFNYSFIIKNKGNFKEKYFLTVTSQNLGIDYKTHLHLGAGSDSLFVLKQAIKPEMLESNRDERIKIELVSETGKLAFNFITATSIPQSIKKNPSAFDQVTLNYETGLFAFNNQVSYFGHVKGAVDFKKTNVSFFYRTKQLGLANTVDKNIFGITVKRNKSTFYLGDLSATQFFYSRGLGASATLTSKGGNEFSLSFIKGQYFTFLDGDLLTASARYKLPFKMAMEQKIAVNTQEGKEARYIVHNEMRLVRNKLLQLTISGGLGYDRPLNEERHPGMSYGYQAGFAYKSLTINSSLARNDKNYPGFGKSRIDERHNIKWQLKKFAVNAFMVQNAFLVNPFSDTLYFSDFLVSNTKRYGLGTNFNMKAGNISLAYGRAHSTMLTSNSLAKYNTIEVSTNIRTGKRSGIQFSTISGYDPKKEFGNSAFSTNTRFSYTNKYFGLTGLFIRTPMFVEEGTDKRRLQGFMETLNFGPSANFRIASALHVQLNYQFQKSIIDKTMTQFVTGNISYTGRKNGLVFHLQFTNPIIRSEANGLGLNSSSYNLTVSKTFRLPIPGTRKHYSLKLHLFSDRNLNGRQENGEESLEGRIVKIGEDRLRTNKEGDVAYKNIPPGEVSIDLSSTVKEIYPAQGKAMQVRVHESKTINIPYVPNKAIKGQIRLTVDEYSNRKFSLAGVKVMAVDSLGNVYSALADAEGNFSIYVPFGHFTVSVNADALGGELKSKLAGYPALLTDKEEPFVIIELVQKKRAIRFIN